MKNTKENTDLNMGRAKNDRWKKILGIILNIALLLLIDGLLVYTFINEGNRIYKGTIIKILLIVTGNILFLVLLFWGEKICSAIKNTTFLKIACHIAVGNSWNCIYACPDGHLGVGI